MISADLNQTFYIRPAQEKDATAIADNTTAAYRQTFIGGGILKPDTPMRTTEEKVREMLAKPEEERLFVFCKADGDTGEKVIGNINITLGKTAKYPGEGERRKEYSEKGCGIIGMLAIHPDYQKKGLTPFFSQLLPVARDELNLKSVDVIVYSVSMNRKGLESFGFEEVEARSPLPESFQYYTDEALNMIHYIFKLNINK